MKHTARNITAILMILVLCLQDILPSFAEVKNRAVISFDEKENGAFLLEETAGDKPAVSVAKALSDRTLSMTDLSWADVLDEDETRREEDVKVFLIDKSNGIAATYGSRVHKTGADGTWVDIDNTLILTGDAYRLKDGAFDLLLPETLGSAKASLSENDVPVSWSWNDTLESKGTVVDTTDKELLDSPFYLPNLTSGLLYENAFPNADLSVTVTTVGVKEDIILKSPEAAASYTFTVNIGALFAKQENEYTVILCDAEGTELYRIYAPMMTDATGEISEALYLTLTETCENTVTLTLAADSTWLAAEDRAYPVTLDPYIRTSTTQSAVEDTFITSDHPTAKYGGIGHMYLGMVGFYGTSRLLIKLSLPSLSKGDTVVNAVLNLSQVGDSLYPESSPMEMDLYRVTSSWTESGANWNNMHSAYDSSRIIESVNAVYSASIKRFDFYLTELVKAWYSGTEPNNGILLKRPDDTNSTMWYNIFYTSGFTGAEAYFPVLMIQFLSDVGLEDYRSYHEASAGPAGEAYVNDYSGNLSFTAPLSTSSGLLLPVSTALTYNGYLSAQQSLNNKRGLTAGYGWTFSLSSRIDPLSNGGMSTAEQTLFTKVYNDTGATYRYVFRDADATVHYLYQDGSVYKDEEGLGLTLSLDTSSTAKRYRLDYKDGSYLCFDSNGYLTYIYDRQGRVATETRGSDVYTYRYNARGALAVILKNGAIEAEFFYDLADRLINYKANGVNVDFTYDELNRVCETSYRLNTNTPYRYTVSYGPDNRVESVCLVGGADLWYTYDSLSRVTETELKDGEDTISKTEYSYKDLTGNRTTTQVESLVNKDGEGNVLSEFEYTYDRNGNISNIGEEYRNALTTYTYDSQNRLVQSDWDRDGQAYRYTYSYDAGGNLLSKNYYIWDDVDFVLQSTDTCGYPSSGWKDLLISYNGQSITYDAIGNPLTYYGNRSFTWEGRELKTLTNGTTTASYVYNENGIRTSKTVNGVTTRYYLEDSRICSLSGTAYWTFLYYGDTLTGFIVNNATYYYLRNLQGDIVQIIDESGEALVNYCYDDWGKIISVTGSAAATLGVQNPFRYRGYFYDEETGLYFVSSRYYDPEVGRFISPDTTDVLTATPGALTDKNLYAYCDNNPVMREDKDGQFWNIFAGAVIGAAINIGVSFVAAKLTGEEYTWKNALVDGLSGVITGIAASTGLMALAQAGIGALVGGGGSVVQDLLDGNKIDLARAAFAAVAGGVTGFIGGNGLRADPAVISADRTCLKVLNKVETGAYATVRGAKSAMTQAINRLKKALVPATIKTTATYFGTTVLNKAMNLGFDLIQ